MQKKIRGFFVFSFLKNKFYKKSIIQKKQNYFRDVIGISENGRYENFDVLAEMGYKYNASVNSAIGRIANAIVQMRLKVVDKMSLNALPENPLQKLLDKPLLEAGQTDWLERIFGFYNVAGDSFIYISKGVTSQSKGRVLELEVINPSKITILSCGEGANERVVGYNVEGMKEALGVDEVLHLKTFNPFSSLKGLSPLYACGMSVDVDNESKKWNIATFLNGLNPSGVYTTDGALSDQSYFRLKNQINKNDAGAANGGRPLLLDGGLKFTQTGLNPKDLDFLNAQKYSKIEVASVYNIASVLIGDTDSSTYNNVREAKLDLHNDTAFPLLKSFVDLLNIKLTPIFSNNILIQIDTSSVKALEEDRNSLWGRVDKSNELTINEKRELKGFDTIGNGDVVVINGVALDSILNPIVPRQGKEKVKEIKTENNMHLSVPENFNNFLSCTFKNVSSKNVAILEHKIINSKKDDAIEDSATEVEKFFKAEARLLEMATKDAYSLDDLAIKYNGVLLQNEKEWKPVWEKIYKNISFDYVLKTGAEVAKVVKDKNGISFAFRETFQEEWDNIVNDYFVKIKLGELIKNVQDVTRVAVQKIVIKNAKFGKSVFDTSKDIQTLYANDLELWRAERIARTETMRGTNFAQTEIQKAIDPLRVKAWIATNDNRTRGIKNGDKFDHKNADSQNGWKKIDDFFVVGGQELQFPNDTSRGASAGNTINCRCTMLFANRDNIEV